MGYDLKNDSNCHPINITLAMAMQRYKSGIWLKRLRMAPSIGRKKVDII